MADPDSSTAGGWSMAASRLASACVPSTRLARISSLYASVHRWLATPAPARCTTAPTPASASGGTPPRSARGSQAISSAAAGERRTSDTT